MAVDGTSNFDGIFKAVTQHDGKFLAVDGFAFVEGNFLAVRGISNFDGKSPLYRDRPPVRYLYVGKITEHLPAKYAPILCPSASLELLISPDAHSQAPMTLRGATQAASEGITLRWPYQDS